MVRIELTLTIMSISLLSKYISPRVSLFNEQSFLLVRGPFNFIYTREKDERRGS